VEAKSARLLAPAQIRSYLSDQAVRLAERAAYPRSIYLSFTSGT
jgi:hypothetical protein